jgi:hypothetical protein
MDFHFEMFKFIFLHFLTFVKGLLKYQDTFMPYICFHALILVTNVSLRSQYCNFFIEISFKYSLWATFMGKFNLKVIHIFKNKNLQVSSYGNFTMIYMFLNDIIHFLHFHYY